ncbi:MAG: TIGR00730 family Rossman fold protein [Polaromonas sp.]
MSETIRSVAVFCGSNFGTAPEYAASAAHLGALIAQRGLTLVYGGTHRGLMGVVANAALANGGTVVGVITRSLHARGHLHEGLTRHEVVSDMRARKARMAELVEAFIALPGGLGTLEELLEAATLSQLGDHRKACGALDVRGYYRALRVLLETATSEGFLKPEHRDMLIIETDAARLLDGLSAWTPPTVSKWIGQPDS